TAPPTLLTAGLAGVVTNNGNIILQTTTFGDLVLNQPVSAGAGSVALGSAGTISQTAAGGVKGAGLEVLAANAVAVDAANNVPLLAGQVVNAGQSLSFRDDNTGLTVGAVDVVDGFGARLADQQVVPQTAPPTLLTAGLAGMTTNNGAIALQTTTAGNL